MDLNSYLEKNSAAALARRINVAPAFISQWRTGRKRVPAEHCPAIERETRGVVRCEDLRPDIDWSVLRCDKQHSPEKAAA